MKEYCLMLAAAVLVGGGAQPASSEDFNLDSAACKSQIEAFARLDVDCSLTLSPKAETLGALPKALRPVLTGATCAVPLRFQKADLYGDFISFDGFDLPALEITCAVTEEAAPFSITMDLSCTTSGGTWSCDDIFSEVNGLGILGKILLAYLNEASDAKEQLETLLAEHD